MIKQLKNHLHYGLLAISITSVVSQQALAVERFERIAVRSSNLFMRSLPVSRMHVRLYSSIAPQSPDVDLTAEWNKGWVPNASFRKSDLRESPSTVNC